MNNSSLDGSDIANNVVYNDEVDPKQLHEWIKGASDRLIKQESEINGLKFQMYLLIFFIFGLPLLMNLGGYSGNT